MDYYFVGKTTCEHCNLKTSVETEALDESPDYVFNIEEEKLESPMEGRAEQQQSLVKFFVGTAECEHCHRDFEIDSNTPGLRITKK